jgi:hypothetical protein
MRHTLLVEEGTWEAVGNFYDAEGTGLQGHGETRVVHQNGIWLMEGIMRVVMDQPLEFSNRYEVQPPAPGQAVAPWVSHNPGLGEINGQFTFIEDTILSQFSSKKGKYSGVESWLLIDEGTYVNRGAIFHKDQRISSWAMRLNRR